MQRAACKVVYEIIACYPMMEPPDIPHMLWKPNKPRQRQREQRGTHVLKQTHMTPRALAKEDNDKSSACAHLNTLMISTCSSMDSQPLRRTTPGGREDWSNTLREK
eukprot:1151976-Pelagomonas_calceolata.AAC.3